MTNLHNSLNLPKKILTNSLCIYLQNCVTLSAQLVILCKIPMFYVNMGQIGKFEFCLKKRRPTFPNFLGGILLVCYKGDLSRTNPVEKASVAICSVKNIKCLYYNHY